VRSPINCKQQRGNAVGVNDVCWILYPVNVGKVWYHHDTLASEKSPLLPRTVENASPRHAAATAGCAVSLRNFGQAEPKYGPIRSV
jgi:hypothetical protein